MAPREGACIFRSGVRLVWEGHSSCTLNQDENPRSGGSVRHAGAEALGDTSCTRRLWFLGRGPCASPPCQHCCIREAPALSLCQNLTCYYGQRHPGQTCNFHKVDVYRGACTCMCPSSVPARRAVCKRCSYHLASSWCVCCFFHVP